MPELAWPWMLLALPLPWIAWAALPPAPGLSAPALRLTSDEDAGDLRAANRRGGRPPVWLLIAWLLVCVAAARPQHAGPAVTPPVQARDLVLAVDLSGSMAETDMRLGNRPVDRLTAVKAVVGDFLRRRDGDRVGLVVFGTRAYTLTPLTRDLDTVHEQLLSMEIGMPGRETAIGDAIALSVRHLRDAAAAGTEDGPTPHGDRALVLLTDGVHNAGRIEPGRAAELAATEGVRVHTVAFGGSGPAPGLWGLLLPGAGSEIDEAALQAISDRTGGRFFRARDTGELAGIYAELDRLEQRAQAGEVIRPSIERYPWLLAPALLCILVALAARARRSLAGWAP